jgi:HEAT repeat protein
MRMRSVFPSLISITLFGTLSALPAASQCSHELDRLLVALQNDKSSNDAMQELLQGGNNPEAKACLAHRLPNMLAEYRKRTDGFPDFVWGNEARIAGELRITEAVPPLARRIDMLTSPASGGSLGYNFTDRAASSALMNIGPPAVPVVVQVLKTGSSLQREMAAHVLREIGNDAAWQALEDALPGERDPKVRARIQEAVNSRH